jgi:hypothetical protein
MLDRPGSCPTAETRSNEADKVARRVARTNPSQPDGTWEVGTNPSPDEAHARSKTAKRTVMPPGAPTLHDNEWAHGSTFGLRFQRKPREIDNSCAGAHGPKGFPTFDMVSGFILVTRAT